MSIRGLAEHVAGFYGDSAPEMVDEVESIIRRALGPEGDQDVATPKPGGKRDKRLKANRPASGAGSQGGRVPRRRPRKK
jgi:hypothetical protein